MWKMNDRFAIGWKNFKDLWSICTIGSIYCDVALRRRGFIGEYVKGPEVLVVKTHRKDDWMDDKPAIYIIRDPVKALISYWNYRSTATHSHRKIQPLASFSKSLWSSIHIEHIFIDSHYAVNNTDWIKFFKSACNNWERSVISWTTQRPSNAPLLVIAYEHMVKDTLTEFTKIMNFIQLPFEKHDLEKRLKNDFSTFQRHTHLQLEQYYTLQQWEYLHNKLTKLHDTLRRKGQVTLASIILSYIHEHFSREVEHQKS